MNKGKRYTDILIVDNSSLTLREGELYTNKMNGDFAKELVDLGYKVSYFHFANPTDNSLNVYNLENNGIRCIGVKGVDRNKVYRYLVAYWKLFKEIINNDFIYFYYPSSFKFGAILSYLCLRKYGFYVRGMIGINSKFSKILYKKSFANLTVSDSFTDMINNTTKLKSSFTIRPMIPYGKHDIIYTRCYDTLSSYNILFLGRVTEDKGIFELLEAIKTLARNDFKVRLYIIGAGDCLSKAEQWVAQNNLDDYISFEGFITDDFIKREYYLKTDIFILPSYHEGFPRTLYEAMIFGIPIITTFVGGIPSIMKENINCLKIEPASSDSIVEAVKYAIEHYTEMENLARSVTETISNLLDKRNLSHAQLLDSRINELR